MAAKKESYSRFGLQYYGECWSGADPEMSISDLRISKQCANAFFGECEEDDKGDCIGRANANYIYKLVGKYLNDTSVSATSVVGEKRTGGEQEYTLLQSFQ